MAQVIPTPRRTYAFVFADHVVEPVEGSRKKPTVQPAIDHLRQHVAEVGGEVEVGSDSDIANVKVFDLEFTLTLGFGAIVTLCPRDGGSIKIQSASVITEYYEVVPNATYTLQTKFDSLTDLVNDLDKRITKLEGGSTPE